MRKNTKIIIALPILILIAGLLAFYFSNYNSQDESKLQSALKGALVNVPINGGYEARLTKLDGNNLKGDIIKIESGKRSGGQVIAYLDKIIRYGDFESFIIPFELNYSKEERYLYLGIFYFEPEDVSIVGVNNAPKVLVHPYSYILGKNVSLGTLKHISAGSYSYLIELDYQDDNGTKTERALRFYSELGAFKRDRSCADIARVIEEEKTNGDKYQLCVFDESHACTLEAYKKGNCPLNGYDISIVDNEVTKWGIAQGFLFKDGAFVFPANYEGCSIEDFYNNVCVME